MRWCWVVGVGVGGVVVVIGVGVVVVGGGVVVVGGVVFVFVIMIVAAVFRFVAFVQLVICRLRPYLKRCFKEKNPKFLSATDYADG